MRIFDSPPTLADLKKAIPNLKALFWDMDGTLLNTERVHAEATFDVIKAHAGEKVMKEELIFNFVLGQTDSEVFYRLNKEKLIDNLDLPSFIKIKDQTFIEKIQKSNTSSCLNEDVLSLPIVLDAEVNRPA